ncbi:MAG TPA: vanadium-dependent haloperoxidase, partial [Bryobacteraceae bacterium]|nr:vanadium-dependent haloperoxidase [Bryobacteraceae bacterium]
MRRAILPCIAVALVTSAQAQHVNATSTDLPHQNAVTWWNAVAIEALTPFEGTNPMAHSRTLAILQASVHDAINAVNLRFEPYTPGLLRAPRASADAAVAAASREVLLALLPDRGAFVNEAYERALAGVADGPAKTGGIATGQAAARATLARRHGDGSENGSQPVYAPRPGPGEYQFTPPFNFAAQPGWGRVKPFVVDLKEHELDGPLPLSSRQYARDLEYVKEIGHIASRTRTPEQAEIAKFWYEDSTLGWNRIANIAVRERRLDPWSAARVLALVNFALADGFIAGFEAKYRFRFWRPETAIQQAGADGNSLTEPDPAWRPFLITPPVPDYPSTHTVLGWAAAEVLIEALGNGVRYSTTSLSLPGVTRSYRGFANAAEENGWSRLYAGIHFVDAVKAGRRQGRSIGQAVAEALRPIQQ